MSDSAFYPVFISKNLSSNAALHFVRVITCCVAYLIGAVQTRSGDLVERRLLCFYCVAKMDYFAFLRRLLAYFLPFCEPAAYV